jgi:hypothetical protein
LSLYLKFSLETQKHDFFLYDLIAGVLGNDEFLEVELQGAMACVVALEDLLKEITYEFFEGGWKSSWEASLAGTGSEMKRMMSYSRTRMLMSAFFVSLETYSSCAWGEEAFVLVGFFFEEMAASLG